MDNRILLLVYVEKLVVDKGERTRRSNSYRYGVSGDLTEGPYTVCTMGIGHLDRMIKQFTWRKLDE